MSAWFIPDIRKITGWKDSKLYNTILNHFGKKYLTDFDAQKANQFEGIPEREVIIRKKAHEDDIFVGMRTSDEFPRDYNELEWLNYVEKERTRSSMSKPFKKAIEEARKAKTIKRAGDAKKIHDTKYPQITQIFDWMLDSIVTDAETHYKQDEDEPLNKYRRIKSFVENAVDVIDNPDVLRSMIVPANGKINPGLESILLGIDEVKKNGGEIDPDKIPEYFDLGYLTDDHNAAGLNLEIPKSRKEEIVGEILVSLLDKKKYGWFGKTNLYLIAQSLEDSEQDLKDEFDRLLGNDRDGTKVSNEIWNIVTSKKPEDKVDNRMKAFIDYDDDKGTLAKHIKDNYRGLTRNEPDGKKVGYTQRTHPGVPEDRNIDTRKVRFIEDIFKLYDEREQATKDFKEMFMGSTAKKSVYDRVEKLVDGALHSTNLERETARETYDTHLNYLSTDERDGEKGVIPLMKGKKNPDKVLKNLFKRMVEKYDTANEAALNSSGWVPKNKSKKRKLFSKVSSDDINSMYRELILDKYDTNGNNEINQPIREFAALYQIASAVERVR